jgi:23S rRNA U2552 (ribose-2'-O)-methylase RlmE/FtsJ
MLPAKGAFVLWPPPASGPAPDPPDPEAADRVAADVRRALQACKDLIGANPHRWDAAKRATNEFEAVFARATALGLRPVSRSYFKLLELARDHAALFDPADAPLRSAHLCEGPGGFLQALVDLRRDRHRDRDRDRDAHFGLTLLASGRRVPGWRLPRAVADLPAVHVNDTGGDVLDAAQADAFVARVGGASCRLVTADGGFDFSAGGYNEQEQQCARLLAAQVALALRLQARGGALLLKCFDAFTPATQGVLWLLTRAYARVSLLKPFTSRPANSERYVLAAGFLPRPGGDGPLRARLTALAAGRARVPPGFRLALHAYNAAYAGRQAFYIARALLLRPPRCPASRAEGPASRAEEAAHAALVDAWCAAYLPPALTPAEPRAGTRTSGS